MDYEEFLNFQAVRWANIVPVNGDVRMLVSEEIIKRALRQKRLGWMST